MANRYWVNGSGNWDGSNVDTSHWSTMSGGPSGASVPTSNDNAIFDVNSSNGNYTVSLVNMGGVYPNNQGFCLDLITTAPLNGNMTLFANGRQIINISGNTDFYSGMSVTIGGTGAHTAHRAINPSTIKTNGVNIPWIVTICPVTTLTLLDDLSCVGGDGTLVIQKGIFDANGKNIRTSGILFNQYFNKTVTPGNGTWEIVSGGFTAANYVCASYTITINLPNPASLWTIKFTGNDSYGLFFQPCSGLTFGTLEVATTGNGGNVTINGSYSFDTIKITGIDRTIAFLGGSTTNIKNLQCSGTSGHRNTLTSTNNTQFTINKIDGGIINNDYLNLSFNHVTPSLTTWYAGINSINNGNNLGWNFSSPTTPPYLSGTLTFNGGLVTNNKHVIGITTNPLNGIIDNCIVWLMTETDPIQQAGEGISDINGNYNIRTAYTGSVRVISYKTGTPNIQGVSDIIIPN